MALLKGIFAILAGYLLGCFSTGIVVGKYFANLDIRTKGSGNAGATNMLRTLGWVPSLLTFAGDTIKALIACWIGMRLLGGVGCRLSGIACVCGHNWPVFFGFRGGKGVASSFGVLIFTSPLIAMCVLVLEVGLIAITKTVSIASVSAAIVNAVLSVIVFRRQPFYLICGLILSVMLLYCHRENIRRIAQNRENKLDFAKISKLRKDGKNK